MGDRFPLEGEQFVGSFYTLLDPSQTQMSDANTVEPLQSISHDPGNTDINDSFEWLDEFLSRQHGDANHEQMDPADMSGNVNPGSPLPNV